MTISLIFFPWKIMFFMEKISRKFSWKLMNFFFSKFSRYILDMSICFFGTYECYLDVYQKAKEKIVGKASKKFFQKNFRKGKNINFPENYHEK